MTWTEMIQMRKLKEEQTTGSMELSLYPHEYQHAIETNIYRLTTYQRQAIFLRFWEGLPIARIADRLGMSWDGTADLIDQAVRELREHLWRWKLEGQNQLGSLAF
jgi:DNA-directed RNA polymerase specialized sigma24 family protein